MVWSRLARNIASISPDRTETISDREKWSVVDCAGWAIWWVRGKSCLSVQAAQAPGQQRCGI